MTIIDDNISEHTSARSWEKLVKQHKDEKTLVKMSVREDGVICALFNFNCEFRRKRYCNWFSGESQLLKKSNWIKAIIFAKLNLEAMK